MQKFCPQCGNTHEERGMMCSAECRRKFRNRKRSEKAGEKCRLCGRRIPRPRVKQEELDGVPSEHNGVQESVAHV
jgi:NMD protein affecting ribosome stability and mRNA decay